MKKYFLFLFFLLLVSNIIAQSLSDQLWQRVKKCYSMFEDFDGDGNLDFHKVDDSRNGYLKVSGSWPTCGCSCTSTVGAYKNSKGEYIFLQQDTYVCSWKKTLSSNLPLNKVLPANFGINVFTENTQNYNPAFASFYLDIQIPRYGTETKAKLQLIPIGILVKSDKPIIYSYSQDHSNNVNKESETALLLKIKQIASKLDDDKTLKYLLSKDFNKISETDRSIIKKIIGDDSWGSFKSIDSLANYLNILKSTYNIYSSLKYTTLVLGWDRENSRFYIKSKNGKPKHSTFKAFLINSDYWSPAC